MANGAGVKGTLHSSDTAFLRPSLIYYKYEKTVGIVPTF
jgi:hypothetical protein